MKRPPSQRGSAIIMLFIAVALFGMLAYAFMQGSRTSTSWLDNESGKAAATGAQDCTNAVNLAMKRLEARGCGEYVSAQADGSNFIVGAPTDGSCSVFHPKGGGVKACDLAEACDLTALAIGQGCGGVIHAGVVGGRRIYTTAFNIGSIRWASNTPDVYFVTGANNDSNGLINTNSLVSLTGHGSPFSAAVACRAVGEKWYLPSRQEALLLYNSRNTGELNNTFPAGIYSTSTEHNNGDHFSMNFSTGFWPTVWKANPYVVRCIRSD